MDEGNTWEFFIRSLGRFRHNVILLYGKGKKKRAKSAQKANFSFAFKCARSIKVCVVIMAGETLVLRLSECILN